MPIDDVAAGLLSCPHMYMYILTTNGVERQCLYSVFLGGNDDEPCKILFEMPSGKQTRENFCADGVERVEDAIGWDCHFAHLVCVFNLDSVINDATGIDNREQNQSVLSRAKPHHLAKL
jgi:hypothetical protein